MRHVVLSAFVTGGLMFSPVSTASAQNALNEYMYSSDWSPVPAHDTNFAPGLILGVNTRDGTWEKIGYLGDAKAIELTPGQAILDSAAGATYSGLDASVSGLTKLFGSAFGGFDRDSTVTFSGVHMNTYRLENDGQDALFKKSTNGATYKEVLRWWQPDRVTLLLVTEVAYATSAEAQLSKENSYHAGVGSPRTVGCNFPTAPPIPQHQGPGGGGAAPQAAHLPLLMEHTGGRHQRRQTPELVERCWYRKRCCGCKTKNGSGSCRGSGESRRITDQCRLEVLHQQARSRHISLG